MNKLRTNGFILKVVAIVTMVIDHMTAAFELALPENIYRIGRNIGRTSFPLFAYMIAVGYMHTSDKKNYLLRLVGVGIISEVLFDYLLFDRFYVPSYNNIFFTLALGLLALIISGYIRENIKNKYLGAILELVVAVLLGFVAEYCHTDYGFYGVFLIYTFYVYLRSKDKITLLLPMIFGITQTPYVLPAYVLIYLDDGTHGRHLSKYITYLFYPAHILVAILLRGFVGL